VVGKTIWRYRSLEKLGQGGIGVVYRARNMHLDRFVAADYYIGERSSRGWTRGAGFRRFRTAAGSHRPGNGSIACVRPQVGLS